MQCKKYNNNPSLLIDYLFFVCLVVSTTDTAMVSYPVYLQGDAETQRE